MVRWVVRSILHGVDPLSYFLFQPVLHDWCNNGRGMCNPVCGMVHIKEPLLLIGKSSLCGSSGFPFSLSEWSLTICLMPYNRIWWSTIWAVRQETRYRYMGCSFLLAASVLVHAPYHRQDSTPTAFAIPVVEHWLERETAKWDHHERLILQLITLWVVTLP